MTPLRVALVTNALGPPTRGNGTTVARWRAWLPDVDVEPVAIAPGEPLPDDGFDLVHGYHAIHGGVHAAALARAAGLPLVVSLGGTDLWMLRVAAAPPSAPPARLAPLFERVARIAPTSQRVIASARMVTGAFPSFGRALDELLPEPVTYATVPRGVDVPDTPPPSPSLDQLRVLLPVGVRPVKDPVFAIDLFERLAAALPASLAIVGPDLDTEHGAVVRERIAGHPEIERAEVAQEAMRGAYADADVVWNTSLHEGGSNALLEALAHGCAVYARDVPGNRDLLAAPEAPGTLFDDDARDVLSFHRALLDETADARLQRVTTARAWLSAHHDSAAEARSLRVAYEQALS